MTLLSRAPTDCVQFYTGKAGNVKSYNFGGGQLIQSLTYQNCIRTEAGYCAIQWKESSTTSPDPFQIGTLATTGANGAAGTVCGQFVYIPGLSKDGINKIPDDPGLKGFQSQVCGSNFGIEMDPVATGVISEELTCK